MSSISQTPAYNLKVVLKETGLTADVLRAWERRYGLPHPERTTGGQRLYSLYDITLVRWLQARQAEGLSISHAAERFRDAVDAGRDPLSENTPGPLPATALPSYASGAQVEILRRRWIDACLAFGETAADQALNQAFGIYPVRMVCTEIIQHGLSLIGDLWYQGQASVQQEHYASELAARRLQSMIAATPAPSLGQTILVGCPPDEFHSFPLLLLTLFLRREGYNVIFLGANVPAERLTQVIGLVHADLVVLAAQRLPAAASLRKLAAHLQAQGVQTAYGGGIFNHIPSLRDRIPAHFLGETIETAMERIDFLSEHPLPTREVSPVPASLAAAAQAFQTQRGLIEAEVIAAMLPHGVSLEQLSPANEFMGTDLTAALELGDPSALVASMEWFRAWIAAQGKPQEVLPAYLAAFREAAQKILGSQGDPIVQWISLLKEN